FSILTVLTWEGIIAHNVIEGSVNTEQFLRFLEECAMCNPSSLALDQILLNNPYPGLQSILILDNCSIH
ncbi:hypothetical protein C8F04DRAFT_982649, partial [Mycena alexandri]